MLCDADIWTKSGYNLTLPPGAWALSWARGVSSSMLAGRLPLNRGSMLLTFNPGTWCPSRTGGRWEGWDPLMLLVFGPCLGHALCRAAIAWTLAPF